MSPKFTTQMHHDDQEKADLTFIITFYLQFKCHRSFHNILVDILNFSHLLIPLHLDLQENIRCCIRCSYEIACWVFMLSL